MIACSNTSLTRHLLRGAGGLALLTASFRLPGHPHAWLAFLCLPAAFLLFRGCPLCWTVGLVETLAYRFHKSQENTHAKL